MASMSLKEALADQGTLESLQYNPESFRFGESVSLVVATKHAPPSVIIQDDAQGGFTAEGPLPNFMEVLAKSMNFTYTLVTAPDKAWGAELTNGTWTGLVGMMMREEADVAVATVCRTSARSRVVDYAWPVVVTSGKIMAVRDSPKINPWGFALPLAPAVWMGIILSLLAACALLILLDKNPKDYSYHNWAFHNIFGYIRTALNQGISLNSSTYVWKRILVGSWVVLVAILMWSYSCNLIALLATRHIGQPIQYLQDLIDHPSMTLIIEKHTVFSNFVDKATSGILREVSNLRNHGRLLYLPNKDIPEAIENLVRRGTHVLLINAARFNKIAADDFSNAGRCDFYSAKESVLPFGCGIIVKKGNPLIPAINYRLGMIESSGLYQMWERKFMPNSTSCMNAPSKITVREAFSLNSIWGMLIVLMSGLLLATLVFTLELIIRQ